MTVADSSCQLLTAHFYFLPEYWLLTTGFIIHLKLIHGFLNDSWWQLQTAHLDFLIDYFFLTDNFGFIIQVKIRLHYLNDSWWQLLSSELKLFCSTFDSGFYQSGKILDLLANWELMTATVSCWQLIWIFWLFIGLQVLTDNFGFIIVKIRLGYLNDS